MAVGKRVTKHPHGTVTEFDDGRKIVETKHGVVEMDADGSAKVSSPVGTIEIDPDGTSRISATKIRKISIDDITSVAVHTIEDSGKTVHHHIVFNDGGEYNITYKKTGELVEFRGNAVKQTITKDGLVLLRSADSADE